MLRSPKRKLRETAFSDARAHSLGSRLGLPGVPVCSTQQEKPAADVLAAGLRGYR